MFSYILSYLYCPIDNVLSILNAIKLVFFYCIYRIQWDWGAFITTFLYWMLSN